MRGKEAEPPVHVNMFNESSQFDQYLQSHQMGYRRGTGAKSRLLDDGSIDVAINRGFFLQGGIRENQLQAIVEHERIELTTTEADPHLAATIGEYRFILRASGESGLREYHSKLCNLYGGRNDTRNQALSSVLKK